MIKKTKKPILKKKPSKKKPRKKTKKKAPRRLTPRELLVCHARIQNPTWDNSRCYRVGNTTCNRNSSYTMAHEFFKKPLIKKYIDNFRKRMIQKVEVDQQYVLKALMRIIEFNPQCLLDSEGIPLTLDELDPEDAKAIEAISEFETIYIHGPGDIKIPKRVISKFRTGKYTTAVDLLGKYLNMWSDKSDLNVIVKDRKFVLEFHDYKRKNDDKPDK